jgi:sensor domain CHASE-containing protein
MPTTTTTLRRSNPIVIGAGLLSLALGAAALAGYAFSIRELTTLLAGSAPMRLPTAAAAALSGLSLLALAGARVRASAALAILVALVGVATLVQAVLGLPMLPWEARLWAGGAQASRSTLTAVCFLLVALSLLLMGVLRVRHRLALAGLLGSLAASIGAVAFLAYFSGVGSAFVQGHLTTMSAPTALCCLALGAAVIRFAWRDSAAPWASAPVWLPLLVVSAGLAITFTLWEAVVADAREDLDSRIAFDAAYLRSEIEGEIESRIQPLIRLGRRRAASLDFGADDWEADSQAIMMRGGYQAIQWVDPSGRAVWMTPAGAGDALSTGAAAFEPRRRAAFEKAQRARVATLTPPVDLVNGGKGFLAVVPVFSHDALLGHVVGVFAYQSLFSDVLSLTVTPRYTFSILDGAEELYQHDAGGRSTEWARQYTLNVHGASWRLGLWPGARLIAESQKSSSGALLTAGVLLSIFFGLVVRLIQAGQAPPRVAGVIAEASSESLLAEATTPVISYDRHGALQAWNDAARTLFAAAPPPLAFTGGPGFRMVRLMILRAAPEGDFRMLLDSCALPALVFAPDGAFAMCNQAAVRLLGWSDAQWQGRRIAPDGAGQPRTIAALLILGQTAVAQTATAV